MRKKIEAYYNFYTICKNLKAIEKDLEELKKNIKNLTSDEISQIKADLKKLVKKIEKF